MAAKKRALRPSATRAFGSAAFSAPSHQLLLHYERNIIANAQLPAHAMKVSRAQAEENRRIVIETAGRLFRQYGFDGIGLTGLMGAAGLTQGGFYNQFLSKDDLAVQACERVLTDSVDKLTQAVEADSDPLTMLIKGYLSPAHRDTIGEGCIFPSLGSDAARHGPEMIRAFEAGVKSYLGVIEQAIRVSAPSVDNIDPIPFLSTMVGALLLSRLVQDEALSRRILKSATNSLLKYAPPSAATRKKKNAPK